MSEFFLPAIMRKMELIVEGRERDEAITVGATAYPPCFESRTQYESWVEAADPEMGSSPPVRTDWPLEPNYCRDCCASHRNQMRKEGRCLFPDTIFITVGTGVDEEIVGVAK